MILPKKWTNKDIELFKSKYPEENKEVILQLFPEYQWRSLQNIAVHLKIKRIFCEQRQGDITVLFNKKYITFYWLGFLLADGYIGETGIVKLDLAVKDKKQVERFAQYINTDVNNYGRYKGDLKNGTGICRAKVKDHINGPKLRIYLGIIGKKTYNPFSLDFIKNKYQLVSFLVGFIDGDGNINKKGYIAIDCHKNYYIKFIELGELLKEKNIITTYGITLYKDMVRITFSMYKDTFNIKQLAIKMNLPFLERKWNNISKEVRSKNHLLDNKSIIKNLRKRNFILKDICKAINYKSPGTLLGFCQLHRI